nr:RHS repeat-associated core domain-containing protein [Streptomyces sp. SID13031]
MDRSQRARVQKFPRGVAAAVSLALLVSALNANMTAEAAPSMESESPPAVVKVQSQPDVVSAVVSARSQGSKVEVESMRTDRATTWANPDGTMTTEAHAAPIRFKTAKGAWQAINLTLQKGKDGSIAPRGHKLGLRLGKRNAASGQVFAEASAGTGQQVEWVAPWKLPEPSLDGTKATYAEVQPGVDMTMDARRSGFEADFVVKQRPVVAPVWRIPLRTKGLTPKALPDGSIEFVDAKNTVRSTIPVSYMWDSVTDPATGVSANKTIVRVTVEQVSAGKATLVIAPDARWFLDPARVFPVTVDPTYANTPFYSTFDTFVQSGWPSDLSTTVDLRVGKNGTTTERSFLNFAGSTFQGKDITAANLFIYQYGGTTCTATQMNLHAALPASTSTRWTSQPVTSQQVWGSVSAAKGFSAACPGGRIAVPMTALAQHWSGTTDTTVGVMLKAANEADANAWKRIVSSEGDADPYVSLTWNRAPGKPDAPIYTEAVAYAAPGATASSLYSPTLKPYVKSKASDPDLNTVKYIYEFHTTPIGPDSLKGTCGSLTLASGSTAGCRPSDLPDNTPLYVRVKANDGRIDGVWSNFVRVITGTQTPAAPVVSCPAPYADGAWQDTAPTADVTCTITAVGTSYSAPGYLRITVPSTAYKATSAGTTTTGSPTTTTRVKITPSSDPSIAKATLTFDKDMLGLHQITVQAETPAGKLSVSSAYSFGWGGTSMTTPTAESRTVTTGTVKIAAAGPPKGQSATPTAKVRWRVSGYGSAEETVGWNEDTTAALTVTDKGAGGITVEGSWDSKEAKIDAFLDADPATAGIQPTTLSPQAPVLLDVQVCFTYGSATQCTWSQAPNTTIQRIPHAFDDKFPVEDAGPGQVALWTGEFNMEATDVSVPGYTGDLSISRSHSTYTDETDAVNEVFGPGWIAQFDGADVGGGGLRVIDSTRLDGTLALVSGDGTRLVWKSPTGTRRNSANFASGPWVPANDETEASGASLVMSGSGALTTLAYTDDDGVVTTYQPASAPLQTVVARFRPVGIAEPGVVTKTTYSYDGSGRVARILAPTPPGVTCAATGTLNPGCRALRFDYGTTGSAAGRLVGAWLDIYNPAKSGGAGMDSIKVAVYTYDGSGRLASESDPRSNLTTEYSYNGLNQITSVKPAGQLPYVLNYITAEGRTKLDSVTRSRPVGDPAGGIATLAKFVYGVPLSGTGLPDLTGTSVALWSQKSAPAMGYAVFGADHPLSGTPSEDDWQHATLQYADASGSVVNTADYGAGAWQMTASDYNDQGNIARELDERALRLLSDHDMPTGAADQLATVTTYNSDITNAAGNEVVTSAGTLVTDVYSPAHWAVLKDGTKQWVRKHVHTSYDQNAPDQGIDPDTTTPYRLPTTETTSTADAGTGLDVETISQNLNDYGPSTDNTLWKLGQPGRTITDVNLNGTADSGTDIITVTRYDAEGRIVEVRQPASNGADAGTFKTTYYVAGVATPAACGGKPQWAGLVCQTAPAAAPTSGSTLPTTTTTAYDYLLSPTVIVESSGTVTRTKTLAYQPDGRAKSTNTLVSGLTGSTPNTDKEMFYDPALGLQTKTTAKRADGTTSSITTGYDGWGRKTTYQPDGQAATTTTYNAAGDVATVTDDNGSTQYSYDGTDALGRIERRGLVTKVDVTVAGVTFTSTGAYDPADDLTIQKLPGGITQTTERDNVGELTGLQYSGKVTTTNSDGSTAIDPNGGWLSWSADHDTVGRVSEEWTPDGAQYATGATPYDRAYSYDNADRLVQTLDRTAPAGTDPTALEAAPCQTRTYQYDANSNRQKKTTADVANGSCATSGGADQTRAFDTADRPSAHTYDQLGRTTTITAGDSPKPANGATALAYYDNDALRRVAQGPIATTYDLDAADRRAKETTTISGGPTTETTSYYNDESDNPSWVVQAGKPRRYAELVGTDLGLTIDSDSVDLTITNPHGDIVSTVAVPPTSIPAEQLGGWNNFDEYGNAALTNTASTGPANYGWLGADQRASTPTGLQLMGARVYNPTTGTFSSTDPIRGGNANSYTYPGDPINRFDISGKKAKSERGAKRLTNRQIKRYKRLIRKYGKTYRSFRQKVKKAKRAGRKIPWGCKWAILAAGGLLFGAALAGFAWALIPIVAALGFAIYEVLQHCGRLPKPNTGGKD